MSPTVAKKVAPTTPATEAPKTSVAEAAKAAVQSQTKNAKVPANRLVNLEFATPPEGVHKSKGVPSGAMLRITAAKPEPGVYIVDSQNRGHHSIIVVGKGTEMATHGGCVQAARAVKFANEHGRIYDLPVNGQFANSEVQALLSN